MWIPLCDRIVNSFENLIGEREQHSATKAGKRENKLDAESSERGDISAAAGEIPVYGLRRNCDISNGGEGKERETS